MTTLTIDEVQGRLREVLAGLRTGEEVVLTDNGQPLGRLLRAVSPPRKPRKAGNCKGMIKIVADDDEHLKDFEEYM